MKQLHTLASPGFSVVAYCAEDSGAMFRPAGTLPLPHWPNERWNMEVSLFLNELLDTQYEHEPRGGTLGTYCAYLAPLVRFCFEKRRKEGFLSITDQDFAVQVEGLYKAKSLKNGREVQTYNRTTVRAMVSVWLDFLSFLGKTFGDTSFIGEHGRIRARRIRVARAGGGSTETWAHTALGESDPYNRRMPLRDAQLRALRVAAAQVRAPEFAKKRRLSMLEAFDVLGFRRIEAHLLRVADVRAALKAAKKDFEAHATAPDDDDLRRRASFLSFRMRKQADGAKERPRKVPVSAVTLQFFKEYLRVRRDALKDEGLKESDTDGSFFVNPKTGRAYEPGYFTQEFWKLARAANILEPCSPHMARARYFTRELVRLILAHKLENADDFRRALINSEAFLNQVREISGHADPESLKVYIDLAFAEVAGLAKTLDRVEAQRTFDAIQAANERYVLAVSAGADAAEAGAELSRALASASNRS